MTTTDILPVLEFLITISLVLVIFKAKVVAFQMGISDYQIKPCLNLNTCLNLFPGYRTIILVTVGINIQLVTCELLSELLRF
jgi:hypothetical protein